MPVKLENIVGVSPEASELDALANLILGQPPITRDSVGFLTAKSVEDRVRIIIYAAKKVIEGVTRENYDRILDSKPSFEEWSKQRLSSLDASIVKLQAIVGFKTSAEDILSLINKTAPSDGEGYGHFSTFFHGVIKPRSVKEPAGNWNDYLTQMPLNFLASLHEKQSIIEAMKPRENTFNVTLEPAEANSITFLAERFHRGELDISVYTKIVARVGELLRGTALFARQKEFLLPKEFTEKQEVVTSVFAQAAYDGHPEIYLGILDKLHPYTQSELWTKGKAFDARSKTVCDDPPLLLIAKKAPQYLERAFSIIADYPLQTQLTIFNGSSKSPMVLSKCRQLVAQKIQALPDALKPQSASSSETLLPHPAVQKLVERLSQMNWNGDKKKQAVLIALETIISDKSTKDGKGPLQRIQDALNDRRSPLSKALNTKRWGGIAFWDETTGSYKAIKAEFDKIAAGAGAGAGAGASAAAAASAAASQKPKG